ncbi:hypothetical protein EMIT043CA1_90001 [Pseudomonas brassicacearum]
MDDFVGPDLRAVGPAAGVVHLGADVAAEHHPWVVEHFEAQGILLPDLQQIEQHGAVQFALGAEVVMQVGTRQLHFGGDVGHGGAAEAFLGKDLLGGQQDFLDVTATNLDLVIAHEGSLATALTKTSIHPLLKTLGIPVGAGEACDLLILIDRSHAPAWECRQGRSAFRSGR